MATTQPTSVLNESDIHGIVMKLLDSQDLVENRDIFAGALGIRLYTLEDIKTNNSIHREGSYGYFKDVLTSWISMTPPNDLTLVKLIDVLKSNGFLQAANSLDPGYREEHKPCVTNKILFDLIVPVESFTGRVADLEYIGLHIKQSQIVVSGLGGIGKSEIAKKFAALNKAEYDCIIWINAENHTNMSSSFKRLAQKKLKIGLKYPDGNEKEIMDLLEEVYESKLLLYSRTLLIFDNAEKYNSEIGGDGIIHFLPPTGSKFHVLITARQSQWSPKIIVHQLDTFTEEESKAFVETSLKINDNSQNEYILELAKLLQYFPLALQQAVAYIVESNDEIQNVDSSREYTISDYLAQYDERTKELLDFHFPDHTDDRYLKTTFTTWEITFEKIKKHDNGETAIKIMNIMSYLAPDMIPTKMFQNLFNGSEKELGGVLQLCKRYSMLIITKNCINIHRLVQDVIRLKVQQEGRQRDVLLDTFKELDSYIPQDNMVTIHNTTNAMISHIEVLTTRTSKCFMVSEITGWEIILDYFDKMKHHLGRVYLTFGMNQKAKQILTEELSRKEILYGQNSIKLCNTIGNLAIVFGKFGDYETEKELLEKTLQIEDTSYGPDHINSARTLSNLGTAFAKLGDRVKDKELQERALKIMKSHHEPDDIHLAEAFSNLGVAYGKLGDHMKEKEMYDAALRIEEKYYGPEHIEIAITLGNLGYACGMLGEFERDKELQEQALFIKEKYYGPDHIELVITLGNLGTAYATLGSFERAKELIDRGRQIVERHYGPDHIQLASYLAGLGRVNIMLGDRSCAKSLLTRALRMQENFYGPNHIESAETLSSLGVICGDEGDHAKDKQFQERALNIQETNLGLNNIDVATTLGNLARAYRNLKDHNMEITFIERQVQITKDIYGKDHPEVMVLLENLARAYENSGI